MFRLANVKISAEHIPAIIYAYRVSGHTLQDLADLYNVSKAQIRRIVLGERKGGLDNGRRHEVDLDKLRKFLRRRGYREVGDVFSPPA